LDLVLVIIKKSSQRMDVIIPGIELMKERISECFQEKVTIKIKKKGHVNGYHSSTFKVRRSVVVQWEPFIPFLP
jgi:hypothetical protein